MFSSRDLFSSPSGHFSGALIFIGVAFLFLTGCTTTSLEKYETFKPEFKAEEFFNGSLSAHGVVKRRNGQVIRTFNADIQAHWAGNTGYLEEVFVFNDGEVQTRSWVLEKAGDGKYYATANDVVGTGSASQSGNAFNLAYILEIAFRDRNVRVSVDDWMWLVDEDVLINHSSLRKFGFEVASIQLAIIRHGKQ